MTEEANIVHMPGADEDDAYVTGELTLRDRVREALHLDGLSQAAAAHEIGISPAALSQWLQNKYTGRNEQVAASVEIWLSARARRDQARSAMPETPRFFRSPSSEKVVNTLSYGQMAGDIVCVYGHPGVGKTVTLRHYRQTNPNVWIATMAPHSSGLVTALEEVAEAVGLRDVSGGARKIARSIRRKIEGTRGLLIIDEAQHLSVAALEEMRSIHDATGIGVALVGNPDVYARLTGGSRSMQFAQLFSRIGMRVFLARPTVGDVRALAQAWGIKGKAEITLLREIASEPGALRGASNVLALASMAGAAEGGITVQMLHRARANLGAQE